MLTRRRLISAQWIRGCGFDGMAKAMEGRAQGGFDGAVFHEAACMEWPEPAASSDGRPNPRAQEIDSIKKRYFRPVWTIT